MASSQRRSLDYEEDDYYLDYDELPPIFTPRRGAASNRFAPRRRRPPTRARRPTRRRGPIPRRTTYQRSVKGPPLRQGIRPVQKAIVSKQKDNDYIYEDDDYDYIVTPFVISEDFDLESFKDDKSAPNEEEGKIKEARHVPLPLSTFFRTKEKDVAKAHSRDPFDYKPRYETSKPFKPPSKPRFQTKAPFVALPRPREDPHFKTPKPFTVLSTKRPPLEDEMPSRPYPSVKTLVEENYVRIQRPRPKKVLRKKPPTRRPSYQASMPMPENPFGKKNAFPWGERGRKNNFEHFQKNFFDLIDEHNEDGGHSFDSKPFTIPPTVASSPKNFYDNFNSQEK